MNDGMGSVAYSYDQLSRLQWENRHFNGVSNPSSTDQNYKITYGYNLAGELTSITDPFGAQVGYNHDTAGRVTSVTGSGFLNVSSYASNIQYRAWGAQKSVSYSDTSSAITSYNSRMQPSSYQLSPSEFKLREQFQYYDDGRLKQMTDLDDRNQDIGYPDTARHFSRAHSYDQVGRLTAATGTPQATFPYNQNYSYDPFNNLTSRDGAYYYQTPTSDSASFSNSRRQGWDYYADGQVKHNPIAYDYNGNVTAYRDWTYDAAGRMTQVQETVTNPSSVSTYVTSYDGDGKQALEYYQENPTNSKSYMVRSSVLGGKVLTRLDYAGNKAMTIVNVDGRLLAVQKGVSYANQYATVQWTHTDPLGLSEAGDTKSVYDPLGTYIPWQHIPTAPPNAYPPHSPGYGGSGSLFGSSQDRSCTFNGLPISCSDLVHQIDIGNVSAVELLQGGSKSKEAPVIPFGLGMFYIDGRALRGDSGGYKGTKKGEDGEEYEIIDGNTNSTRGHYLFFLRSVAPTPQNPSQTKPPCPPVPDGPSDANLDDNIRSAAGSFKDALEPKWYAGPDSGEDPMGKLAGHAMWFYKQVRDKGPWDYKYRDPAINEGKRSKYEPFGNFNYGGAGAAAGFSEGQLLRLAGHYQTDKTYAEGQNPGMVRSILGVGGRTPYGDEPGDQEQIRSGINYYRRKFVLRDCQ